ncbi:unnamed protein product, partial [Cylicostephanus goldi]
MKIFNGGLLKLFFFQFRKPLEILEEGRLSPTPSEHKEGLIEDSRTIPIWLALLLCISWVCGCAALFLIWEKRWTFFTSLYFFFISLSTIGLGDVVPDHPHMLILMFFLVIIGLSIVSMLLTVIQIKFEECLYNLMMRMQEEYQKNLANGTPFDHEQIRKKAMEEQPFFMNIACDPMSDNGRVANGETQWSRQFSTTAPDEITSYGDDRDSISDATSLPLDSI